MMDLSHIDDEVMKEWGGLSASLLSTPSKRDLTVIDDRCKPDPIERVIRPVVEGQIRGFIKEHPSILQGVNWYRPRDDKAVTLTNSLAKRIVRDLLSAQTKARLEAAMFEAWENEKNSDVDHTTASDVRVDGRSTVTRHNAGVELPPALTGGPLGSFPERAASFIEGHDCLCDRVEIARAAAMLGDE